MIINLTNFKSWKSKVITIKKGVTLFSGKSGIGKTSILEAILFALFGKISLYKKFGEEECKVVFIHEEYDMHITRIKKTSVTVIHKNNTYIDSQAQDIINKFYIKFIDIFYSRQNGIKSFAQLQPGGKLQFLRSLSIYDFDIDQIQNKTKELVKSREYDATKINTILDTKLQSIEKINTKTFLNENDPQIIIKLIQKTKQDYVDNKTKLKELTNNYNFLRNTSEEINLIQNSLTMSVNQQKIIQIKIDKIDINNKPIQIWKTQYYEQKKQYAEYIKNKENINVYNRITDKLTNYKSELDDKRTVIKKLKNEIKEFNTEEYYTSLIDKLNESKYKIEQYTTYKNDQTKIKNNLKKISITQEELDKIQKQKNTIQNKLQKIINMRELEKNKLECPNCNEQLYLRNGKLNICNSNLTDSKCIVSKLQNELNNINTTLYNKNKLYENKKYLKKQLNTINTKLQNFNINKSVNITQIDIDTQKNQNILQKVRKIKNSLHLYKKNKNELKYNIEQCNQKLKLFSLKSSANLDEQKVINTISELQRNIENYNHQNNQLNEYKTQLKDISNNINRYKNDIQLAKQKIEQKFDCVENISTLKNTLEQNIENIQKSITHFQDVLVKEINEWNIYNEQVQKQNKLLNEINILKNKKFRLQKRYEASLFFKQKLKYTEYSILNYLISDINRQIAPLLEDLFPENCMNIQLANFKTNKKEAVPDINMIINYKNNERNNINFLSGGEIQRVNIAFSLAFANMFDIPFLLLDESTSNLDEQMTNIVINTIKKNCNTPYTVMIAHQVVSGIFDHVETF